MPAKNTQNHHQYDIDRKQLLTVKQRYLKINEQRKLRTEQALGKNDYLLKLLPVLFHVNHPLLPGFISYDAPSTVNQFKLDKNQLALTRRISKGFNHLGSIQAYDDKPDITAIYVMGSCGTVGHSGQSDIDLWVCYDDHLDKDQVKLLKSKCEFIDQWMIQNGLETHCFAMNAKQFREGLREELSGDDCGSTQHQLLLDEFYRSSILLAGSIPAWLMVPPDWQGDYNNYLQTLTSQRYLFPKEIIDFGDIQEVPAGEFIGAGIWQLYKGINAPYKSVLKIILNEVYASEYPHVKTLSQIYKSKLYQRNTNPNELDPYVLIYRKLEKYLIKTKQLTRLDFVRRCFYCKVGIKLSRKSIHEKIANDTQQLYWREKIMSDLLNEWQWEKEAVNHLDYRNNWTIEEISSEQELIIHELKKSFRFISNLARIQSSDSLVSSSEMTLLSRKLYTAFEKKPGKVNLINSGICVNPTRRVLNFYRDPENRENWCVNDATSHYDQHPMIKSSNSLVYLMAWCHINELISKLTEFNIFDNENKLTSYEFIQLLRKIQVAIDNNQINNNDDSRFTKALKVNEQYLLINVGTNPLAYIHDFGLELISHKDDTLSYSSQKLSLINSIDLLQINNWGEVIIKRYEGENSVENYLRDSLSQNHYIADEVYCYSPNRANAIVQRIKELLSDIITWQINQDSKQYILKLASHFIVLNKQGERIVLESLASQEALNFYLKNANNSPSKVELDTHYLKNNSIAAVINDNQENHIQIYWQQLAESIQIYIADEIGAITHLSTANTDANYSLQSLDDFINAVVMKQHNLHANNIDSNYKIEYKELLNTGNNYEIKNKKPSNSSVKQHRFIVTAFAEYNKNKELQFTIYCNEKEFSQKKLADNFYPSIAKYILSMRPSKQRYPCFISDLELASNLLGDNTEISTANYLRYKVFLETKINQSLQFV